MQPRGPFFIIGCVRSGTTMLRDILRMHPNLAAPEETHFYRWMEPFGTDAFRKQMLSTGTLARHRELDGIDAEAFAALLAKSQTRAELCRGYMELYRERNKPGARRWFDKTPQNVFGAAMLATDFPKARFVHIVRNPLDVVVSLRTGAIMHIDSVVAGANYWRESVATMATLRKACRDRVLEFRYEDFMTDPRGHTARVLEFVGEPFDAGFMDAFVPQPKSYDHGSELTPRQLGIVRAICGAHAKRYGYDLSGAATKPREGATPAAAAPAGP